MTGPYPGAVVRIVSALLVPFIMVFGFYVIAHGHYGPGGGFAGGVVLAVGVILLRITADEELAHRKFPPYLGLLVGAAGMLGFVAVGLAPLLGGGQFLDYAGLDVAGAPDAQLRYLGILVVEFAVGFAVFGTLVLIFDALAGRGIMRPPATTTTGSAPAVATGRPRVSTAPGKPRARGSGPRTADHGGDELEDGERR